MDVINYLVKSKNINIVQNTQMFNFSLDSILLPNFVTLNKNIKKILDIGCGNAPIPLILSTKTQADIIGIEIQKEVFELADKSVKINNLQDRIKIINDDVKEYAKQFNNEVFDVITCNPPFFKVNEKSNFKKDIYKTIARHEIFLTLSDVLKVSRKLLKNNGVIAMVHRPDRLVEILEEMRKNNIEPKRIQFVYPKRGLSANILLIEGRKNGNPGLKILPPIYIHNDDGEYTKEIKIFFN